MNDETTWVGWAPATSKKHPYGFCNIYNCWDDAVLEEARCGRHRS